MGGLALVEIIQVDTIQTIIIGIMLLIVAIYQRKKIEVLTERIKSQEGLTNSMRELVNSMKNITNSAISLYDPQTLNRALQLHSQKIKSEIESRLKKEMEEAIKEKEQDLEFTRKELFAAILALSDALGFLPPPIREKVVKDMEESTLKSSIARTIKIYEKLDKTKPSNVLESMIKQQST